MRGMLTLSVMTLLRQKEDCKTISLIQNQSHYALQCEIGSLGYWVVFRSERLLIKVSDSLEDARVIVDRLRLLLLGLTPLEILIHFLGF